MLKNPSKVHQDTLTNSSKPKMLSMSDEQVEEYVRVLFNSSPRANFETAPAEEWLQFLEKINEQRNYFILSEQQKKAIRPYFVQNADLEMTPDEFVMLLSIIRNEPIKEEQSPRAASSTSVTRKLASGKSATGYYDDRASTNHPDDNVTHTSEQAKDLDFTDENNDNGQDMSLLKRSRKEKNVATIPLREYESRIVDINKEYSERISQLQTRLEKMQIDAEQQKGLLGDQKNKERVRLERIAELNSQNEDYEKKHTLLLKQLQKKGEELDKLRGELRILQEAHNITLSKLDATEFQAKELARVHEKEKADLQLKLDQEKRQAMDQRHTLEAQQNENVKLMELIDRQKFDLDEARSGLRYYSNTSSTALDKKSSTAASTSLKKDGSEQSLAHEQMEAEYTKKLESVKQERDTYQQQLVVVQNELKQEQTAAALLQASQTERIQDLSNDFDQQLSLIESIRLNISSNQHGRGSKLFFGLSIIPWIFLFYHVLLILFYYLLEVTHMEPPQIYPLSFSNFIDELFFKYL